MEGKKSKAECGGSPQTAALTELIDYVYFQFKLPTHRATGQDLTGCKADGAAALSFLFHDAVFRNFRHSASRKCLWKVHFQFRRLAS